MNCSNRPILDFGVNLQTVNTYNFSLLVNRDPLTEISSFPAPPLLFLSTGSPHNNRAISLLLTGVRSFIIGLLLLGEGESHSG